MARALIQGKV